MRDGRRPSEGTAMLTAERLQSRAQLAPSAARAKRRPDDPDAAQALAEARRRDRFVAASDYIQRVVDEAPPLPAEERDRLAQLLRGTP